VESSEIEHILNLWEDLSTKDLNTWNYIDPNESFVQVVLQLTGWIEYVVKIT